MIFIGLSIALIIHRYVRDRLIESFPAEAYPLEGIRAPHIFLFFFFFFRESANDRLFFLSLSYARDLSQSLRESGALARNTCRAFPPSGFLPRRLVCIKPAAARTTPRKSSLYLDCCGTADQGASLSRRRGIPGRNSVAVCIGAPADRTAIMARSNYVNCTTHTDERARLPKRPEWPRRM